jgi:hypothetical protein
MARKQSGAAIAIVCVVAALLGGIYAADTPAAPADPIRDQLEKKKLEQEVQKLQEEVQSLKNANDGLGRFLPWFQALGLGALVGAILTVAGANLSRLQNRKLKQDEKFATDDHYLETQKLKQEMDIGRGQHNLKLFEALGSPEPRIRLGAVSALSQRAREAPEDLQTILRVLIGVTKHEDNRDLQKHIADAIVDVLGACKPDLPVSPLKQFNFQGARLTNAWWKEVDARGADFYRAQLPRAGLANGRLDDAVFKNADLTGATLRDAQARRASFEGANMTRVKAEGIDLEGADLRNAIVTGADFSRAKFRGAKLRGVDLNSAITDGADRTGIDWKS